VKKIVKSVLFTTERWLVWFTVVAWNKNALPLLLTLFTLQLHLIWIMWEENIVKCRSHFYLVYFT